MNSSHSTSPGIQLTDDTSVSGSICECTHGLRLFVGYDLGVPFIFDTVKALLGFKTFWNSNLGVFVGGSASEAHNHTNLVRRPCFSGRHLSVPCLCQSSKVPHWMHRDRILSFLYTVYLEALGFTRHTAHCAISLQSTASVVLTLSLSAQAVGFFTPYSLTP